MKALLLLVFLFPFTLLGQHSNPLYVDLRMESMDLSGLSFRITGVVNETGVSDGRYGTVYTGLLNKQRDLAFEPALEHNLHSTIVRSTTVREVPAATLLVRFLRVDEEIFATHERRRLQLEAALAVTDAAGERRLYGPRQRTVVEGGLDVTDGHGKAIAEAVAALLRDLDADFRSGISTASSSAPGELPDGALYSFADLRAGRVDTSLTLGLEHIRPTHHIDGVSYTEATFTRADTVTRREVRQLWAYRHSGTTYLFLQNRFRSLHRDSTGRTLVAVRGGLTDPEAVTRRAVLGGLVLGAAGAVIGAVAVQDRFEELFVINPSTGGLEPVLVPDDSGSLANHIMLYYEPGEAAPELTVRINHDESDLLPGHHLVLDRGGVLKLATTDGALQLENKIWNTPGAVALYRIAVNQRGKLTLTRGSTEHAEAFGRQTMGDVTAPVE